MTSARAALNFRESRVLSVLRDSTQEWEMIGFAVRTYAASMLALYVAFALQLESPHWACMTVWILAKPAPGMVISKGIYRLFGTFLGAFFGVVLIALFAQEPEGFVLALALLSAGATVASNVLKTLPGYAFALTAYTAGIIAAGAIAVPGNVFLIAMARVSCVLVGIASTVIVTTISTRRRAAATAGRALLAALQAALREAADSVERNAAGAPFFPTLVRDLIALDVTIDCAAAESGTFRNQANRARNLVMHLFGLISAARAFARHRARCERPDGCPGLTDCSQAVHDCLKNASVQLERGQQDGLITNMAALQHRFDALRPEADSPSTEAVDARLVVDRLHDILVHARAAVESWRGIVEGQRDRRPTFSLHFHRDLRGAWINGLRTFVAIAVVGVLWIGSAWPSGPTALVFVAVILVLFSSTPHPDRVGWGLLWISLPTTILALACKFLILPDGFGFEYLALSLGLCLIPLGLIMAYPPLSPLGSGAALVLLNLLVPTNVQVYSLPGSLNTSLALLIGILLGTLAYVLIFPPNPSAARRCVAYRIRRSLELAARVEVGPASLMAWETTMYDRVLRLWNPAYPSETTASDWPSAGLAALDIGREIFRLRDWLETETMPAEITNAVIEVVTSFRNFLRQPGLSGSAVKEQAEELTKIDGLKTRAERRARARALGAFREIQYLLAAHPRLTTP